MAACPLLIISLPGTWFIKMVYQLNH